MRLPGSVPRTHGFQTLLRDRYIFVVARVVPRAVAEDGVLRQTGSCGVPRPSVRQFALPTIPRYERNSRLLLTEPTAAILIVRIVGRSSATMPSFALASTLVRHFPVIGYNRQRFTTVIISNPQQFFTQLSIITIIYFRFNMATCCYYSGSCTTGSDCC